jgi:hypothetical protein
MIISELIKALQQRLEIYGDIRVVYRDDESYAEDVDIFTLYYDDEWDKVILSNDLYLKELSDNLGNKHEEV